MPRTKSVLFLARIILFLMFLIWTLQNLGSITGPRCESTDCGDPPSEAPKALRYFYTSFLFSQYLSLKYNQDAKIGTKDCILYLNFYSIKINSI